MVNLLYYAIIFAISYLLGAIPWGLLIGLACGKDVRLEGSGNIGATNVTRVVGAWQGKLCFALDFLKGALPVAAAEAAMSRSSALELVFLPVTAAVAAVLGHMFPVFLKFRGGKGVSTAAGALMALAPPACAVGAAVWAAVFLAWRYVSLASILAALAVVAAAVVFSVTGLYRLPTPTIGFVAVAAALAIARHRDNIKRLLNGTESRFERRR